MKKLHLVIALLATVASPYAFAQSTGTGQVAANVPNSCEIVSIDSSTANFGMNVASTMTSGNIQVLCNLDTGYSLTADTVDQDGRFEIAQISGNGGAPMIVELKDGLTGSAWTPGYLVGGEGTGTFAYHPFQLEFNPGSGLLPAYGSYAGSFDVTLHPTL